MRIQKESLKHIPPEILDQWIEKWGDSRYYFWCPGCLTIHCVNVKQHGWNNSVDLPTFTPSVLVTWRDFSVEDDVNSPVKDFRCHSFVTDGRIQFLGDCTHGLANQTVELPEHETWPEWARQDLK